MEVTHEYLNRIQLLKRSSKICIVLESDLKRDNDTKKTNGFTQSTIENIKNCFKVPNMLKNEPETRPWTKWEQDMDTEHNEIIKFKNIEANHC